MSISFSIIMPTYNRKYCIKNAIDSLLKQTYQDFELIIIDDGSTDQTEEFIKDTYNKYLSDEKIRYIKLDKNYGVSFARNVGLENVKNEWVGYLDTDNQMRLDFLETFSKNILENLDYNIFYAQTKTIQDDYVFGSPFDFRRLIFENIMDLGVFVHRVKLFKLLGGFDTELKRAVDWDLFIRYTKDNKPFFIEKVLLDYDNDIDNKDRITNKEKLENCYKKIILKYLEEAESDGFMINYQYFYLKCLEEKKLFDEMENQVNTLEEKNIYLREIIEEKDNEIHVRDGQIRDIFESTSWKITKPIRLIKDKILEILSLIKKVYFLYRREGVVFVVNKIMEVSSRKMKSIMFNVINNIKAKYYKIKDLTKKSINVFRKDGFVILAKKIFSYLTRKDEYLKIKNNYSNKEVVFISGTPGSAMRYRCSHQSEQLKKHGIDSDIFLFSEDMDIKEMFPFYDVFILHRVPITDKLKDGIEIGKKNNKIFIFDSDDLVFGQEYSNSIRAMTYIPKYEADLYFEGLSRYEELMSLCDYSIASTEKIKREMEKHGKIAFLNENSVSDEMIEISERCKNNKTKSKKQKNIILGYMSGTNTHNFDFEEISGVLFKLMDMFDNISLLIVGPLDLNSKFNKYKNRIIRKNLVPWRDLPCVISGVDINLAPLEIGNDFCESKSDLKYFEAALVSIPTIASSTEPYKKNIVDGFNGFLCKDDDDWERKIRYLIENKEKIIEIGRMANNEVVAKRNTEETGKNLVKILNEIKSLQKKNIIINWVLQAPIKGSGGYTTIFKMAKFLVREKYTCNIYISRTEHLAYKDDNYILSFLRDNFDVVGLNLFLGWDNFIESDITFATAWATADVVNKIKNTKNRCYFVQDYEPWFFEPETTNYNLAKETYSLGLDIVSIGPYLSNKIKKDFGYKKTYFFDFYSDRNIYFLEPNKGKKIRIIFYARPSTKRRGFSLGVAALSIINKKYGDRIEIALYGDNNLDSYGIDFPFINLGIVSNKELARQFAKSHIGISFSFTNMSLVPLDMMSCRCAVVELNSDTVKYDLIDNYNCLVAENSPDSVAEKLSILIDDDNRREKIVNDAYEFVNKRSQEKSISQLIEAINNIINDN